jgi:hypothetical protein
MLVLNIKYSQPLKHDVKNWLSARLIFGTKKTKLPIHQKHRYEFPWSLPSSMLAPLQLLYKGETWILSILRLNRKQIQKIERHQQEFMANIIVGGANSSGTIAWSVLNLRKWISATNGWKHHTVAFLHPLFARSAMPRTISISLNLR